MFPESKEVIEYYLDEEEEEDPDDAPVFVESRAGTTLLQYKGYRYGKKYKTKRGTRWGCAINKNCSAFLILNRNDEITVANTRHEHGAAKRESHERIDENQDGKWKRFDHCDFVRPFFIIFFTLLIFQIQKLSCDGFREYTKPNLISCETIQLFIIKLLVR